MRQPGVRRPTSVHDRIIEAEPGVRRRSVEDGGKAVRSLLLVAHGSRRAESNAEIARLRERLAKAAVGRFEVVEHAFLELAEPLIPDGIERCLARGATSVQVLPYFLARGTHVAEDIPEQVAIKQREHPDRNIRITDYLGTSDALVEVLVGLAVAESGSGGPEAVEQ